MATYNYLTGTFTNTQQYKNDAGSNTLTVQAEAYIITDSTVDPPNGFAGIDIGNPNPIAASVWTINILGSVIVPEDYSGGGFVSNALQIQNYSATASNKLTVGADGTIFLAKTLAFRPGRPPT